jgi:hypothetical protein
MSDRRPIWEKAFLTSFAARAIINDAAKDARVSRMTVWRHRKQDPEFAQAFKDAHEQAADNLEAEAWRRGHDGVDEPQFYKGAVCGHIRKYSDVVLLRLLEAYRPEKYRQRFTLSPGELDEAIRRELAIARGEGTPAEDDNLQVSGTVS